MKTAIALILASFMLVGCSKPEPVQETRPKKDDYARETNFEGCLDYCRGKYGSGDRFSTCYAECLDSFGR